MQISTLNNLGILAFETNAFDSASLYFRKAIELNVGFENPSANLKDSQREIQLNKNFELNLSSQYMDSLATIEHVGGAIDSQSNLKLVERYYKVTKNLRLLAQVEDQRLIDIASKEHEQTIYFQKQQAVWLRMILLFIGLLTIVVITAIYFRFRKKKQLLREAEKIRDASLERITNLMS